MKLTDCIALLLRAKALPDLVQAARHVGCTSGTEAEVHSAWDALRVHLAANDHRPAVATALALLWLDSDGAIRRMRKEGLLRASRYRYNAACIRKVAGAALELADELALSPERRAYLSSILVLTGIAGGTKQLYQSLVDRLSTRHQFGMKTLMAMVNTAFAVDHPGDPTGDSGTLDYWNATEQASALSRLFTIARDELGIKAWTYVDDVAAEKCESIYTGLLVDAAKLNEFIDAEVMVDGLPYQAQASDEGVVISAIDPDFERSVRLGYIQTTLQMNVRVSILAEQLQRRNTNIVAFKDLLALYAEPLGRCVRLRTFPQSRLVIELPAVPPVIDMLSWDAPFLDEYGLLAGAHVDHFQTAEMGLMRVSEKLTMIDLFKAQRVFTLIDAMFRQKLQAITDEAERRKLLLRSTVMVIKRPNLMQWLKLLTLAVD